MCCLADGKGLYIYHSGHYLEVTTCAVPCHLTGRATVPTMVVVAVTVHQTGATAEAPLVGTEEVVAEAGMCRMMLSNWNY